MAHDQAPKSAEGLSLPILVEKSYDNVMHVMRRLHRMRFQSTVRPDLTKEFADRIVNAMYFHTADGLGGFAVQLNVAEHDQDRADPTIMNWAAQGFEVSMKENRRVINAVGGIVEPQENEPEASANPALQTVPIIELDWLEVNWLGLYNELPSLVMNHRHRGADLLD